MEEMYAVKDNCLFVMMPKEMDHHKADTIRMKIDEYLLDHKAQNVIFDFENTRFMDSSGIGIVLGRYNKMAVSGGQVIIRNARGLVRQILEMSGIFSLMKHEEDKE